jgi:DNA-binding MarR family transcriptional regulator
MAGLAERQNLTQMQAAVLYSVDQEGELAMGKIADMLHCDASNVTGIVDRLVAQGLVMRNECPQDRRTKTLKLTDKGRQVVKSLKDALPQKLGCNKLDSQDQDKLHDLIRKVCS